MTLDEEERRGFEAQRILSEPLIKEAFDKTEEHIISAMRQVPMGDTKTQHELVLTLQLLGRIKGHIKDVVTTGQFAQTSKLQQIKQTALRAVGR